MLKNDVIQKSTLTPLYESAPVSDETLPWFWHQFFREKFGIYCTTLNETRVKNRRNYWLNSLQIQSVVRRKMNMNNFLDLKACQLLKTYLNDLLKSLKLLNNYSSIYDNSAVIARYVSLNLDKLAFYPLHGSGTTVVKSCLQTDKVIP